MMLLSLGVRLYEVRWATGSLGVIGGVVCPLTGIAMARCSRRCSASTRTQQGLLILFGACLRRC